MKNRKFVIGLLALVVANVIWGLMAPIIKGLLNMEVMSGMTVSALRIIGGTILFWLIDLLAPSGMVKHEKIQKKKDWMMLVIGGIVYIVGTMALTNIGAEYTYPVDAVVCSSTTPLFALACGAIFYYHKFPAFTKILGVLLGLLGVLIFIFTTEDNPAMHVSNPLIGDLLCVISQICNAVYLVFFVEITSRYTAFTMMKWMFTFACAAILPFTIADVIAVPWSTLSGEAIFDITYIVVLASFVSYLLISFAQHSVTPTLIAMGNYIQPLTAAIASIIIGMAVVTVYNIVATALIFIGVILVQRNTGRLKIDHPEGSCESAGKQIGKTVKA